MCLAVPALIIEKENGVATCRVGEGDTYVKASLALIEPEPELGQYLIIHAGFGLRVLDEREAQETLSILRDMVRLQEEEMAQREANRSPRKD
jgi:hydrogenase expression/formation protein HypC